MKFKLINIILLLFQPGHIIEVLESKKFTTLLKLLEAANLTESLANGGEEEIFINN